MQTFKDVWTMVDEFCATKVGDVAYNMWIHTIEPVDFKNGEAVLKVPHNIHKKVIDQTYAELIKTAFQLIMGFPVGLRVLCEENPDLTGNHAIPAEPSGYEYTFDTYIVGSSNRFAHAASMAVAEKPSIVYNPLVIYGNSGVGKTHLMLAIYNHVKHKYPTKDILYVHSEEFISDFITDVHEGRMEEFRNRYRNVDILLVDDIQFIAGKEETQVEFFNTFNALHLNNKQIVVTSDRPPKDIKALDERLRSRFESGLITDIAPPEFETRVGIIKRKAQMIGLDIEDEVVYYIAENIKQNIRQLEGTVKKLQMNYKIDGVKPTIAHVQNVIRDIKNDFQPEPITVTKVIEEVGRTYSVSYDDIMSKKQNAPVTKVRQICMYIVREITDMSLEEIGANFGKNHATVLHSINKVASIMEAQPKEKNVIEDIIKNLQTPID